jgi:phage tail sheath gpL-like
MSDSLSGSFVPTIDFTQIPPAGSLLVPGVYIEIGVNYSNIGILPFPARALAIGVMLTSGGATPGTIYSITQKTQAVQLFGAGSPLSEQIAYFLAGNPGIPIDAVGLEATGTAAAGSVTFGGTVNFNGTQAFGLAGFRIPVVLTTGMTAAQMATAFVAAAASIYNAQNLPVSLATNATAGQVAITALFPGVAGNELDLRINPAQGDQSVPGVTMAIVPIGTGTVGAGVASIAAVLTAIATTWYTDILIGLNDSVSLAALQTALTSRYTAMQNVDSHAYVAWKGTQGQLDADIAGLDCPFISVMGVTNPQDPTWRWSAALAGVAAAALMADPARQLRGLALPNIIAPAPADRMFEPEQNALLEVGIATWLVAPDGTVIIQRLVTSYTTSPLGVPDGAWRDIMTPKVMTRIRYDWKNYLLLNWPQAKLAPDGSLAAEYDSSVATPKRIQASWAARCTLYARAGWIENEAATIAASVFSIDPNDKNRLNSQRQVQVIGNLMIDAEQLLFAA